MAQQSNSDLGLHRNTVEKQIEEANILIERVMAALREIKIGITQYRISNKAAASEDQQAASVTELKDRCKSAKCPEECGRLDTQPTPPTEPNPPPPPPPEKPEEKVPERVIKMGGCTPETCPAKQSSYQVPAEKPLVDQEAQEITSLLEKDDDAADDAAAEDDEIKGDAEDGNAGDGVSEGDDDDDDAIPKCPKCVDSDKKEEQNTCSADADKKAEENTISLDALKAKLSLISETPSCCKDQGQSAAVEAAHEKNEVVSKVSFSVSVSSSAKKVRAPPPSEREEEVAGPTQCVECQRSYTGDPPCVCAGLVSELLAAESAERAAACADGGAPCPGPAPPCPAAAVLEKLRRLQVQAMPPVCIRGGLAVQRVIELAIKSTGSTDVMFDPQGNVGYEAVNYEEAKDTSSRNHPVSFVALEVDKSVQMSFDIIRDRTIHELRELRERMQGNAITSLDEDLGCVDPGSAGGGAKLHVLQSFQVLNTLDVGHVPEDDPLAVASILSGSIDVQVYKTFIDPNVEIIGIGEFGDLTEEDVEFARVRRTSLKTCGSTLIATKSKERTSREADPSHAVQTRPIPEEEDWDVDDLGDEDGSTGSETTQDDSVADDSTQTDQERADGQEDTQDEGREGEENEFAEALPDIGILLPPECVEQEQQTQQQQQPKTNKLGMRTPFELGMYENKSIQCGSSHLPKKRNHTTQMSEVSSSESTGTESSYTSQSSSCGGDGMTHRGVQVSLTEVSEEGEEEEDADEEEGEHEGGHVPEEEHRTLEKADVEYVSSDEDVPAGHNSDPNEAVSEFLTGLTEKSANKIDVYSKSHGNLHPDDDSSIEGIDMDTVSVATMDLDENAQMLKNLVHDPSSKKLISKQSTIYKQIASRSVESTSQCCQVEFDNVDIWQPKINEKEDLLPSTTHTAAAAEEDYERNLNQGELCNIEDIQQVKKSPRLLASDTHSRRYTLDISASAPATLDDSLSEGEYRCKCSVSSGEIHICPFSRDMRTRIKYVKKHTRKFFRKDGREPVLDVVAQRSFYNNWLNYYADSDNPTSNNDTSNNTDL